MKAMFKHTARAGCAIAVAFALACAVGLALGDAQKTSVLLAHNVLYQVGESDVYALDVMRHLAVNLTRSPYSDFIPYWERASGRILFAANRESVLGESFVYSMAPDGRDLRYVSRWYSYTTNFILSPDGRYSAFVENKTLYIKATDGGETRQLTRGVYANMPAWSPDSASIAFASNHGGDMDIYRVSLADGSLINLSAHPASDTWPVWSPDGQRLAFVSARTGDADIYVLDLANRSLTNLTQHPHEDRMPSWSPDGQFIAFASRRGGWPGIYVVAADSGRIHAVYRGYDRPAWRE